LANVWAAVGRIGAAFLDGGEEGKGFFSQLKPLTVDFTETIDGMGDKPEQYGVKFGEAFTGIVDKVKGVINWFRDLNEGQRQLILKVGAFAVALGPLFTGLGRPGGAIAKVSSGLGVFFKWLAPILTPLKGIGTAAAGSGRALGILRTVFTALTGPIGITVAIIT